ncbi:MAG: hypothetical protein SVV80_14345, partial [Planctomycetota bacterium]|nr:hypothetical protein [Planctomycetota bacterium]
GDLIFAHFVSPLKESFSLRYLNFRDEAFEVFVEDFFLLGLFRIASLYLHHRPVRRIEAAFVRSRLREL